MCSCANTHRPPLLTEPFCSYHGGHNPSCTRAHPLSSAFSSVKIKSYHLWQLPGCHLLGHGDHMVCWGDSRRTNVGGISRCPNTALRVTKVLTGLSWALGWVTINHWQWQKKIWFSLRMICFSKSLQLINFVLTREDACIVQDQSGHRRSCGCIADQ